jgi:hypothetical protein
MEVESHRIIRAVWMMTWNNPIIRSSIWYRMDTVVLFARGWTTQDVRDTYVPHYWRNLKYLRDKTNDSVTMALLQLFTAQLQRWRN